MLKSHQSPDVDLSAPSGAKQIQTSQTIDVWMKQSSWHRIFGTGLEFSGLSNGFASNSGFIAARPHIPS